MTMEVDNDKIDEAVLALLYQRLDPSAAIERLERLKQISAAAVSDMANTTREKMMVCSGHRFSL